jgi:hypothetical protein
MSRMADIALQWPGQPKDVSPRVVTLALVHLEIVFARRLHYREYHGGQGRARVPGVHSATRQWRRGRRG